MNEAQFGTRGKETNASSTASQPKFKQMEIPGHINKFMHQNQMTNMDILAPAKKAKTITFQKREEMKKENKLN